MWFSDKEIHPPDDAASPRQPRPRRLLAPHVEPLVRRLDKLLGAADDAAEEVRRRVLIVGIETRITLKHFEKSRLGAAPAQAAVGLHLAAAGREKSQRQISPQRLVHYRENWYLDAWCHLRGGLRALRWTRSATSRTPRQPARDVPQATLDAVLGPGYGHLRRRPAAVGHPALSAERSRWVTAGSGIRRRKAASGPTAATSSKSRTRITASC